MPATPDERHLIERTLAGDREAFRTIVLRHQRRLAELIFRQTGDRAGTEDMVQETFLRAYQALERFDPRYRLSTWLARIALNVARDQHRRAVVRRDSLPRLGASAELAGDDAAPEAAALRSELRAQVGEALGALPEAQREVVVLSIYGGLTQREVAGALELPLGTVKSRMRTALARLRTLVAPLEPGGAA